MDMIQGHYDSRGVVVLVVSIAPGMPRSLTRRVQLQRQQCVRSPHTCYIILSIILRSIPGTVPGFPQDIHTSISIFF